MGSVRKLGRLLVITSVVVAFQLTPTLVRADDVFDLDHPCAISAASPAQAGNRAVGTGSYDCPNPHRNMTIVLSIELLTTGGGGYSTIATETCDSGNTPTTFIPCSVTANNVCRPGATLMKTTGYGWWENSSGQKKGNNYGESLPVPVVCLDP